MTCETMGYGLLDTIELKEIYVHPPEKQRERLNRKTRHSYIEILWQHLDDVLP